MIKKARIVQEVEFYFPDTDPEPKWVGLVRTHLDEGDVVVYFPFFDDVKVFDSETFGESFVPLPEDG